MAEVWQMGYTLSCNLAFLRLDHGTRILKPSKFKLLLVFCLKIQILLKFLGFLDTLRIFTDLNGENKSLQYHRQQHISLWLMVHWSTPPPHSPWMELQVSPT